MPFSYIIMNIPEKAITIADILLIHKVSSLIITEKIYMRSGSVEYMTEVCAGSVREPPDMKSVWLSMTPRNARIRDVLIWLIFQIICFRKKIKISSEVMATLVIVTENDEISGEIYFTSI